MRLRWCGLALRAFLRRWGVYVLVAATVAGAGAAGWQQIIAALAAWLVLPLFFAASQGAWLLLALLLQALFGAACVWAMRSLLWPPAWGESERALPLPAGVTRRSDVVVVLIGLTPLLLLEATGALALLAHQPAWLQPVRGRAVASLLLACLISVALGVMLLQRARRPPSGGATLSPHLGGTRQTRRMSGLRALVWLPLWRGPARRTGWTLALGMLLLLSPMAGLWRLPVGEPWWLAVYSLAGLWLATRISHLSRIEFEDLLQAALSLPLAQTGLKTARAALGLLAMLPGLLGLTLMVHLLRAPGLRVAVLWIWAVACAASAAVEVLSPPAADPATKSGRWLFSLICCLCLASEVIA